MIGIYKITSPSGRVYIGQSIDIKNRFREYKRLKCKGQTRLYASFKKYTVNKHLFEILCECDFEDLNKMERYYQDLYSVLGKKGLNCILQSTDVRPAKVSRETIEKYCMTRFGRMPLPKKEKFRNNLIGINNPFYGKKHTEETKKKISEANKGVNSYNYGKTGVLSHNYGRKHSDEVNSKKGRTGSDNYFYGKSHTEDAKRKMSLSRIGKRTLSDNHKAKRVINTDTKQIYGSLKELSILIGLSYDAMRGRLKKPDYIYQWYEVYKNRTL